MSDLEGGHLIMRDDDPRAHPGGSPQIMRETFGDADAAVRCRIARQHALMDRYARPSNPLHERHRRIAVEIGAVELLLADDAEDAGRCGMAGNSSGYPRMGDGNATGVKRHALIADRDSDQQRALRRLDDWIPLRCFDRLAFRLAIVGPRRLDPAMARAKGWLDRALVRAIRVDPALLRAVVRPEEGAEELCMGCIGGHQNGNAEARGKRRASAGDPRAIVAHVLPGRSTSG